MPFADKFSAVSLIYVHQMGGLLFSPGSNFSVWSLAIALLVAVAALALQRRAGKRAPRLRAWLRVLFPKRILASASLKADAGLFLFNTLAYGALFGWAVLAVNQVGGAVKTGLTAALGAPAPTVLPAALVSAIATLALFLAYEIAYWLDHYTSHKIPFFWAFHKAHHTAEVLTPLTVFRVHPIDGLKLGNISALILGPASGVLAWTFGGPVHAYTVNGSNLLLVAFVYLVVHLQHSQIWIASTGVWGRLVFSPAHHQIHHSDNPIHFDRNFGSALAVWDWLAGTLYTPSTRRERISFGAGAAVHRPHSLTGTLITPFVEAAAALRPTPRPSEPTNAKAAATA